MSEQGEKLPSSPDFEKVLGELGYVDTTETAALKAEASLELDEAKKADLLDRYGILMREATEEQSDLAKLGALIAQAELKIKLGFDIQAKLDFDEEYGILDEAWMYKDSGRLSEEQYQQIKALAKSLA